MADRDWKDLSGSGFSSLFLVFCLLVSGTVYDIKLNAPTMGSIPDPKAGIIKPQAFMVGRINGQYVAEGISAGFLVFVGGLGLVLLHRADEGSASNRNNRFLLIFAGFLSIIIGFNLLTAFVRIKIPGYLLSSV
ncbi:hypothetical protein GUITHDRAFT_155106 [Guillardia theta CCMP2712]|uniref:Oligosaccharyltransferase complex subunit n=1 Tax=Guillardia theta (strain CCMP2712) TaxID=905079 RepID=L1ILC2_GUITC|nr:hypothetical protein GUITHDRAFT_155106 [Guillardia theta CCMP2712]EKX36917.1 hypothetical protein GUITHDRAFT_155106 [Guillardia theta CCMP2712]|eukprot:XP_005823897.1 hypothetical protein GUITHDRAFT_155106 [Guillardia theta CCMP2712]